MAEGEFGVAVFTQCIHPYADYCCEPSAEPSLAGRGFGNPEKCFKYLTAFQGQCRVRDRVRYGYLCSVDAFERNGPSTHEPVATTIIT